MKKTSCAPRYDDEGFDIPPRPDVLGKFQTALNVASPDFHQIERAVASDAGVAGAVLKLANSPRFFRTRSISTLHEAVMFLGLSELSTLVIGEVVKKYLNNSTPVLEQFWRHSVEVAERVSVLAMQPEMKSLQVTGAMAYVYGLLHDCGVAVLLLSIDGYEDLMRRHIHGSENCEFPDFERDSYRLTHAHTGALLTHSWGLPDELTEAIRLHHELRRLASGEHQRISRLALALICLGQLAEITELRKSADFEARIERVFESCSACLDIPVADLRAAVDASAIA